MWEGDAPCRNDCPFAVDALAGSEDSRRAGGFVSVYLAGGSVKGDFKALIQGGAKKRREGRVRDLKRVTDLNVPGGSQENAVLCTVVTSGDIPFCVWRV